MALLEKVEGLAYRLRPVDVSDNPFIVSLRNDPVLSPYMPPLAGTEEQQVNWIRNQRERPDDYYFVVENRLTGRAEGLTGLYEPKIRDDGYRMIEWGRFIVRKDSLAAPETSLLSHKVAFEQLGYDEVFGYAVQENEQVISFHRSCGLEFRGEADKTFELRGQVHHSYCFALTAKLWPNVQEQLLRVCQIAARIVGKHRQSGAVRGAESGAREDADSRAGSGEQPREGGRQ